MGLITDISVNLKGSYSSVLDLVTATAATDTGQRYRTLLQSGVAAGQADKMFSDTRTLGPSATEDLDLAGVLTDAFGAVLTFARIKGLVVAAAAGNTNNVLLGGVANGWATFLSPAATGIITVRPGTFIAMGVGVADATGYAVTAATADLLHVANSAAGTSVSYDIYIIGASA